MPLMLLSRKVAHVADTQASIKVKQDCGGSFMAKQGNKNDTSWHLRGSSPLLRGPETKSSQRKFLLSRLAEIITATVILWGRTCDTTLTLNYLRVTRNKWSSFVSWQSDLQRSLITPPDLNSLAYFKLLTSRGLQIQLSADKFGSSRAPAGQPICHFYFWNPRLALFKSPTTQLTLTPSPTQPHVLVLCQVFYLPDFQGCQWKGL